MVDHHEQLAQFIESYGLTKAQVARMLSAATGDRVSSRTVQSWLYERGTLNARACPGWAIYVLQREIGR